MRLTGKILAITMATGLPGTAFSQDYSSLDTPQEMPSSWVGYYARNAAACRDEGYIEGVAIERRGLHFYEAAALAQRIVWVNQDRELYVYALLGGEGSIGSASYRIRRDEDGRAITFFGGASADSETAPGERLVKCPAI